MRVDGAVLSIGNDGPDPAVARWTSSDGRGHAVVAYGVTRPTDRVRDLAGAGRVFNPDDAWTLLYDGPQLLGPTPGASATSLDYRAGDESVLVTPIEGWDVGLDGLGWLGEEARRTRVRGHDALLTWTGAGGPGAEYHLLWQERPGLTIATDGSAEDRILAVAEGLTEVDEAAWQDLLAEVDGPTGG